MKYTALIPIKSLSEAKSRLATHLTQPQRATLMLGMLHHVISVLHASDTFSHIAVVSADMYVLEQAQKWGALPYLEEQPGHNPALSAAASRELRGGAQALLTISADLPLLRTDDICGMVAQSRQHAVILAPSREGTGTNAVLMRPPLVLPYVFGPGSLQRYLAEAELHQVSQGIYSSVGLALDIDTIDDIETFRRYELCSSVEQTTSCL